MLAALLRVRQAYILSDRSRACRRINSCCCLLQVQLCECRQGVEVASGAVGSLSWGEQPPAAAQLGPAQWGPNTQLACILGPVHAAAKVKEIKVNQ